MGVKEGGKEYGFTSDDSNGTLTFIRNSLGMPPPTLGIGTSGSCLIKTKYASQDMIPVNLDGPGATIVAEQKLVLDSAPSTVS